MKFTAPANSAKMEERPRGFIRRRNALSAPPIGTHLFLLIAKLHDGVTVNMTDGCATMESPRAVRTNEPHGRTPENLSRDTPRRLDLGGWASRGKSRDWEGLTFDGESIYPPIPIYLRARTDRLSGEERAKILQLFGFSPVTRSLPFNAFDKNFNFIVTTKSLISLSGEKINFTAVVRKGI